MLAPGLHEGLVGALNDALGADIDPRPGGHLAVHHQHWATWEHFAELDRAGLMMYGQMTAGSWIYIGSQGIVQGPVRSPP